MQPTSFRTFMAPVRPGDWVKVKYDNKTLVGEVTEVRFTANKAWIYFGENYDLIDAESIIEVRQQSEK